MNQKTEILQTNPKDKTYNFFDEPYDEEIQKPS